MKLFRLPITKRAIKIHNDSQKRIAKYTAEQIKYKANDQKYWHWQRLIDEQNIISLTSVKILSKE